MSCLKLHWPQSLAVFAPVELERVEFERADPERVESFCIHADWSTDADTANSGSGDSEENAPFEDSEPVLLSFPRIAGRIGPNPQRDLLIRARIIHENRFCEDCGRASVNPVDAEPALAFRDSMPVPGSGTLIGFACDCCGHEWRV